MTKLKDFRDTSVFNIIDAWNHRFVETLPAESAMIWYGECEVENGYTCGSNAGGFITDVWVKIPGMRIGYWNSDNLHLHFIGDDRSATFAGKKTGQLITVTKNGENDYEAWWRDPNHANDELAGYSVRGTAKDIIAELKGEI